MLSVLELPLSVVMSGSDGAAGAVLSTVKVAPLAGAEVITLPVRSVPVLSATVAVPAPEPTRCVPVYCVLDTLVMFVAAMVFAPLIENCTTGESAIDSLNVAVIIREVPVFSDPRSEERRVGEECR